MRMMLVKWGFLLENGVKNLYRHRKRYILYGVLLLAALTVFFCAVTVRQAAGAVLETHLDIYAPGGVWIPVEEADLTDAVYSREQVRTADALALPVQRIAWLAGLTVLLLVHYTVRSLRHVRLTEYAVICSAGAGMGTVLLSAAAEMLVFLTGVYIAGIFAGFGAGHLLAAAGAVPDFLPFVLPGRLLCWAGEGGVAVLLLLHILSLARTFRKNTPIRLLSAHS